MFSHDLIVLIKNVVSGFPQMQINTRTIVRQCIHYHEVQWFLIYGYQSLLFEIRKGESNRIKIC